MVKKDKVKAREQPSDCGRKRVLEPPTGDKGGNSSAAAQMNEAVKIKPIDSVATVACLAETNGCVYIVLPDHLPSVKFQPHRQGTAAVMLQDPEGREWRGVYHEKFGFCVLVTLWRKVNAETGIQPGDLLVFSVADASLNKYKFDIVHKQAGK